MSGPTPREPGITWRSVWGACPLCGSDRRVPLGRRGGAAHRLGLGVETSVVRCGDCHGVYQWPVLLPDGNPYVEVVADEYFAQHDREQRIERGFQLAQQAELLLGRKGRLLELGCGRGELLIGASSAGWSARGVEMTEAYVRQAPGIEIEIASLETCHSLEQTYDVVFLAAILEHLYDPLSCLRRCATALASGGLVFIDVPNECGIWAPLGHLYNRLRGRNWSVNLSPTFPPFHVVGFCPRSLRQALERAGFDTLVCRTERWQLPAERVAGIERLLASAILSVGQALGLGMGITCWARVR
jgi:2-polyprenyl-3-methyl-5-hydroxy-6-metoxy-1,4-benzoquinol methylase